MLQLQVSIRMGPDQLHLMVNLPKTHMVLHLDLAIKIKPHMLAHLQGGTGVAVGVISSSQLLDSMEHQQGVEGTVQAGGRVSMAPQQGAGVLMVSQPQTIEQGTLLLPAMKHQPRLCPSTA